MSNTGKNIKKQAVTAYIRYAPKKVKRFTETIVPRIREKTKNSKDFLKTRSDYGRKSLKKELKKRVLGVKKRARKRARKRAKKR